MSTVLLFRASTRSVADRVSPSTACEIVIFPGVRIERHAEPERFEPDTQAPADRDSETPISRTR